jgi:hypothetical protein
MKHNYHIAAIALAASILLPQIGFAKLRAQCSKLQVNQAANVENDPNAVRKLSVFSVNVGPGIFQYQYDLENTDDQRTIAATVQCRNETDLAHPLHFHYVIGPRSFQTVGMFRYPNNSVTVASAVFK